MREKRKINDFFVKTTQPMIPPRRFHIFPLTGGCSEGLDAFRFFLKHGKKQAL